MELINATSMPADYTVAYDATGRESLVVVMKGTFRIPSETAERLRLHADQQPLITSDIFYAEPGVSAPKYETDFAPRKRRCDVLLNGSAYAPGGRPVSRVEVSLHINDWSKSFAVIGDRVWETGAGVATSPPAPFITMPISYDRAFGGTDKNGEDATHASFLPNPIGRGFHARLNPDYIRDAPLPNTEELRTPVNWFSGNYVPMSFGPIGRQWHPRVRYAGTYDQRWIDDVMPFLPEDFDELYHQSAPEDQQIPIPTDAQTVRLVNLSALAEQSFVIPVFEAPVHIFFANGERKELRAQLDTILFEPDEHRLLLTWRVNLPLKKNIFEIVRILIGRKSRAWWRAMTNKKRYFPSLNHLVRARSESVDSFFD